jgi:molybdopterin-containing oxidoreductase family iron-sulfur binding subunit
MRIDRYTNGEGSDAETVHMPMMCQHCDNAPCETVCPVLATAQSAEGLNQQVYNRCVGTRYCANNCPYKVRRFNWFEYARNDDLQNLVLNPDVTVRSRGVMEKCSLCVQRIQDAKAEAKRAGRPVGDGDIQPACAQSCPAGAIVFGDMNDPASRVARLKHDPRHYQVLVELGIKPVVGYLRLVRNRLET